MVACVETATPLKEIDFFWSFEGGASGTQGSIEAMDFQNHSSVGRV